MTVAAEKAVCAWVNGRADLTGTPDDRGPLAQGAFTIEQPSPVGAGHTRSSSGSRARSADGRRDQRLDCATIVQCDLDDRSSQGHRSPKLGWQEPANASDRLAIAQIR